jgi:hypothetical protein
VRWPLFLGWLAVTALVGGAVCLLPLIQPLGYEFALVVSLVASAGAGHLAACYPRRVREQLAPFPGARWPVLMLYLRALLHGLSLLVLPLALNLLNGLRVPQCNAAEGMLFYALLPVLSVALATAGGLLAGLATPGAKSATALWFVALGATLAFALREVYATPVVYSFGPFHGYFPGVLYDALIHVDTRIYTYRLASVIQLLSLLAVAGWLLEPANVRLSLRRGSERPRGLAVAALLAIGALAMHLAGPALGHRTDRQDLEQLLSEHVSVPGLELFFPPGTEPRVVDELTRDAAFSLSQVERFFEAPPGDPIAVFFFAGFEQKRRAMGASRTNVAKPWRGEVYVTVGSTPHRVLRHELAHAVAARFARGPFAVAGALGGWWPNPGLIEGLAVAAQGPKSDLTVHQWAAAMKREKLLPDLDSTFGLSFLGEAQSKVYTATGSFCRFVRETHGADVLRKVYGGQSWEQASGKTVAELETAWHKRLDAIDLSDTDKAAARYEFDRPSVIHSTCVHEVARLRAEAGRAARDRDWEESLALLEAALARSGGDHDLKLEVLYGLLSSGDEDGARSMARELSSDKGLGLVRLDAIEEILADMDAAESPAASARTYALLASRTAGENQRRKLEVKHHLAANHPGLTETLLRVLSRHPGPEPIPAPLQMLMVADAARRNPSDPILAYLVARQHFTFRDDERSLALLDEAEKLGLAGTAQSIWLEARMMRGRTLLREGRFDEARRVFERLVDDDAVREGARERARDWADRCEFSAKQRADLPPLS